MAYKVYLAASLAPEKRAATEEIRQVLLKYGFDVYNPVDNVIPNAWDYPNNEWGLMVFTEDVRAITDCDFMVAISYGREEDTGGTCWEIGYAFGIGKKVIVIEMNPSVPMSLMISNGSYARVQGKTGLQKMLDEWNCDIADMPKKRTKTEQK